MNLSACTKSRGNPYLRNLQPSYDQTGKPIPTKASIELDYLDAMLADLETCYKEVK